MIVQDAPIAAERLAPHPIEAAPRAGRRCRDVLRAFAELAKLRISALALLTTAIGYRLAATGPIRADHLLLILAGTALCATGANAANQILEIAHDRRMLRTRARPLPTGRITLREAALFATCATLAGTLLLALVAPLAALIGLLTVLSYAFVYTPLKRVTPWCTAVGAIPGAMPPVIGATAATGHFGAAAAWLFAILFLWQLPHFYAIAWLYRADYRRGSFPMLSVVADAGPRTARQSVAFAVLMWLATLGPTWSGIATPAYAALAAVLGALFLALVVRFAIERTDRHARQVFIASIVYLPALLALLTSCRV